MNAMDRIARITFYAVGITIGVFLIIVFATLTILFVSQEVRAQTRYVGLRDSSALGVVEVGRDSLLAIGNVNGRVFTLHAESDSADTYTSTYTGELTWDGGLVDDVTLTFVAGMVRLDAWTRPPCLGTPCTHADPTHETEVWLCPAKE